MFVFLLSVDQSSDQLSENPGLTLLHVCAAVLLGVNIKLSFPNFEHTSEILLALYFSWFSFILFAYFHLKFVCVCS